MVGDYDRFVNEGGNAQQVAKPDFWEMLREVVCLGGFVQSWVHGMIGVLEYKEEEYRWDAHCVKPRFAGEIVTSALIRGADSVIAAQELIQNAVAGEPLAPLHQLSEGRNTVSHTRIGRFDRFQHHSGAILRCGL